MTMRHSLRYLTSYKSLHHNVNLNKYPKKTRRGILCDECVRLLLGLNTQRCYNPAKYSFKMIFTALHSHICLLVEGSDSMKYNDTTPTSVLKCFGKLESLPAGNNCN